MYFTKTPALLKPLAADLVWDIPTVEDELFLTFDDGPHPEVTGEVLDYLQAYGAKATFFCVGRNAEQYPELKERILAEGHSIGNHTYAHEKGWNTPKSEYIRSVLKCSDFVESELFRPPFGRISRAQMAALKNRFHIVMWDVLSGDFDPRAGGVKCAMNVINNARRGSIVVFHDSLKCKDNMLFALPRVLQHFREKGFRFSAIRQEQLATERYRDTSISTP